MAEYSGTALYVNFVSTTFQSDFRKLTVNEAMNFIDATAGSDAAETSINGTKKGNATLDMVVQSGGTALWAATVIGTEGTLTWGEEGTASNKPKSVVLAAIESRDRDIPYDDLVALTINWTFRGAVTNTTWT